MNQILYVKPKEKNKKKSSIDINKIIPVFAISLIVFGVAMAGEGVYAVIKNAEYSKQIENLAPSVVLEQNGQYVTIIVSHKKPIDSITYNWNGGENIIIDGNNRKNISEQIEVPKGNNILTVSVKDITNKRTLETKSFSLETGSDIQKPKIDILNEGNRVKITVTDDTEISYVTYRWNNETEETLRPRGAELAKLVELIETKKGKNTLTVVAVDSSNNTSKVEQEVAASTKPTVEVYVDGTDLLIIAKHEDGIERIEFFLNGEKHIVNHYQLEKEMIHREPMVAGTNKIEIKAYNKDGIYGETGGTVDYTPTY